MFNNLFSKSKSVTVAEKQTEPANSGYPSIVDEIHNEFNNAGDKLLSEARRIIAGISVGNEQKANTLSQFGFRNSKEVIETEAALKAKKEQEDIAVALEYFSNKFPQYKFITPDMAMNICKKYDLVLGEVGQYKGFVPQKNLSQIERFFEGENEINTQYIKTNLMSWNLDDEILTKEKYEHECEMLAMIHESQIRTRCHYPIYRHIEKRKSRLSIAAPLKDMNTEGYTLKGRLFSREIPDPVVLAPVQHNSTKLFCIITAWGPEQSDEMVVNQKMN